MQSPVIRLGTRGSRLALAQAEIVRQGLEKSGKIKAEIVVIQTKGDADLEKPLNVIGGKGLFTEALEEALLKDEIHAAVHSLKDLPTTQPKGLDLLACLPREVSSDCLVFPASASPAQIEKLPAGTKIGTSSVRRSAQILKRNPQLVLADMRGNLDTRIQKLLDGKVDVLCLAYAGLLRIGLLEDKRIQVLVLDERDFFPAVGQGVIAVQGKKNCEFKKYIQKLNHEETSICAGMERELLHSFSGGCSLPLGVFSEIVDGELILKAVLLSPDGKEFVTVGEATRDLKDRELVRNIIYEIEQRGLSHLIPGRG